MRVLLFRSLCDTGGVSTWMLAHAAELERVGVPCDFWFCRSSARFPEFEATKQARVGTLSALVPVLESGRYDVVHLPSGDPLADMVARLAPRGTKIVATSHGSVANMFTSRSCDALTAVSQGMADLNQPHTDLAIDVVRNGVDVARFTPDGATQDVEGGPIVAFVGRTTADQKEFPRFTRIAAHLVERGYRVWVADAHNAGWDALEGRGCTRIPIERWQRWSHDEISVLYRSIARSGGLVLLTSKYEGFPFVPVEAAACGAPTATADVVGAREAVSVGTTGMLFAADAADADVATAIVHWLENRGALDRWIARCAEHVHRTFSMPAMTAHYLEIYRRPAPRIQTLPVSASNTPSAEERYLQGWWRDQQPIRAHRLLQAVDGFVDAGYPDHALFALALAARVHLASLLSRKWLPRSMWALARIAGRPQRLRRRLRDQDRSAAVVTAPVAAT
ncbi:MAG TPA: glycosyltransferase family 4 protein [Gemmatimonadaceae bacterium]